MSEKMVVLEEDLFEAKTIQLDLLDKVEYLEPLEGQISLLEGKNSLQEKEISLLEEKLQNVMTNAEQEISELNLNLKVY